MENGYYWLRLEVNNIVGCVVFYVLVIVIVGFFVKDIECIRLIIDDCGI